MDHLIDILVRIPRLILMHCVVALVQKTSKPRLRGKSLLPLPYKMTTIDTTGVYDPKKGAYIIVTKVDNTPPKASTKVASFDLDYTLIKPKSGNKFPRDINDWVVLPGVGGRLTELYQNNYKIVVFTNQGSSSFDPTEFAKKIRAISNDIGVPLQCFVASDYGYCRKPSVGMWRLLTEGNEDVEDVEIDMSKSFYVGDAAGRPKDFSDSDLKFAFNLGLKFFTDVRLLQEKLAKPVHPLDDLDPDNNTVVKPSGGQEMIILVGPPASGKTKFASEFEDYVVVNQDKLKTKPKVISVTKQALKDGRSVIIDRKNEYIEDRKIFIDMASDHEIPVRIVWFDIPRDVSEHLCVYREIMTGTHIPAIVLNKYYSRTKGLEIPKDSEGGEVIRRWFKTDLAVVKNPTIFFSYLV